MSDKIERLKRPDKMVILNPDAITCHVLSDTMRIIITREPSHDPAFDGVRVEVETFIDNGTTDRVFYPYRKPAKDIESLAEAARRRAKRDRHLHELDPDYQHENDPEFEPHIGEWMRWAEEHPEALAPLVKAAIAIDEKAEPTYAGVGVDPDTGNYVVNTRKTVPAWFHLARGCPTHHIQQCQRCTHAWQQRNLK